VICAFQLDLKLKIGLNSANQGEVSARLFLYGMGDGGQQKNAKWKHFPARLHD
jgi:hypothetical protein